MPCGTPELTVVALDEVPSATTCMVRSVRKQVRQVWKVPVTPKLVDLWRRRSWGTVSRLLEVQYSHIHLFPFVKGHQEIVGSGE